MHSIVLIDDEPWSIVDIRRNIDFEGLGMEVVAEYNDSLTALIASIKEPPDIIITDIRMPHLGGMDFIRRMRDNGIAAEVIIISGFQDFEIAREAISHGVCGYCMKPIEPDELTDILKSAAARLAKSEKNTPGIELTDDEMDAFDKLTRHMKTHYSEKLQLGKLAEMFFLSAGHCSYLFAKRKSTTFSRYLLGIRLDAAKTMLAETNRPLADIAQLVGYQDYFYFSRVFKQEEQCSPKEYRRRAAGAAEENPL